MFRIRLLAAPALAVLAFALAMPAAFAAGQAAVGQDVDKVNGSITAEAGQAYGNLQTVNGGIHVEANARTGDAGTVNGGIHVADGARTGGLETVNGGVRVGRHVVMGKGVETVNGEVFVDRGGHVGGDVATVNGGIGLVDTDVDGGISTVSGDITVGVGSHVKGGIRVEKPSSRWSIHFGKPRVQRIVIGPNVVIRDCAVGDGTQVLFAQLSGSSVGEGCQIGPFAYLRPGVVVEDGGKVGTYVEVKNTTIGANAKTVGNVRPEMVFSATKPPERPCSSIPPARATRRSRSWCRAPRCSGRSRGTPGSPATR